MRTRSRHCFAMSSDPCAGGQPGPFTCRCRGSSTGRHFVLCRRGCSGIFMQMRQWSPGEPFMGVGSMPKNRRAAAADFLFTITRFVSDQIEQQQHNKKKKIGLGKAIPPYFLFLVLMGQFKGHTTPVVQQVDGRLVFFLFSIAQNKNKTFYSWKSGQTSLSFDFHQS